jgi:anti-sigma factor RsiW
MDLCREIDALTTSVVDNEATAADRVRVEEHARECAPCGRRFEAERRARQLLRGHAAALVGHAPPGLRARCAAARSESAPPARRPVSLLSRAGWPVALAAALVLAIAGAALYGTVINPSKAVAAQLTIDHLKCFALFEQPAGLVPAAVEAGLKARHGFDIVLPEGAAAGGLTLVGGRRCVYLEGSVAHLLYRRGASRVSLFVLPRGAKLSQTEVDVLGHSAVAFIRGGRTWVVLARVPHAELKAIAAAFGAGSE